MQDFLVPFNNLKEQYASIQPLIEADVLSVLRECQFVGGQYINNFEQALAAYTNNKHIVCCSNGTLAIELMLRAAGVGPGWAVLIPSNTFIATAYATTNIGAYIFFVGFDKDHLISLEDVEFLLPFFKHGKVAVIGVDLYGQRVDFAKFKTITDKYEALLFEDAAQSIGCLDIGKDVVAASTSFYPGKNLGTIGHGGAVITNNTDLSITIRKMVNQGGLTKYQHDILGGNYRLDNIKAVQLQHALSILPWITSSRQAVAKRYRDSLGHSIGSPINHVYHLYEFKCDSLQQKERILCSLNNARIEYGQHYPLLITETEPFKNVSRYSNYLKHPELSLENQLLISLPIFPTITEWQLDYVIQTVMNSI